jgi:hypothetical protein
MEKEEEEVDDDDDDDNREDDDDTDVDGDDDDTAHDATGHSRRRAGTGSWSPGRTATTRPAAVT